MYTFSFSFNIEQVLWKHLVTGAKQSPFRRALPLSFHMQYCDNVCTEPLLIFTLAARQRGMAKVYGNGHSSIVLLTLHV